MCTLRAVFVLSKGGDIVFARRWPTVERRVGGGGVESEALPSSDEDFRSALLRALASAHDQDRFALPILTLKKAIWPVLYLKRVCVASPSRGLELLSTEPHSPFSCSLAHI